MEQSGSRIRRLGARALVALLIGMSGVSACLWAASAWWGPVGPFSLGGYTIVDFPCGAVEVRHFYQHEIAPPVPLDQWPAYAAGKGWSTGATAASMSPAPFARFF